MRFFPLDERGQADAAYGVVVDGRAVGQVVRWGTEWVASDTSGLEVATAARRKDAAAALEAQSA